jgi:hypothetical protein
VVKVDLKGIAKVKAKGNTYWYAWRGGPRLNGQPGSPEFIASYNEAVGQRRTPDKSRFRFVVVDYKQVASTGNSPSLRERNGASGLTESQNTLGNCTSRSSIGRRKFDL